MTIEELRRRLWEAENTCKAACDLHESTSGHHAEIRRLQALITEAEAREQAAALAERRAALIIAIAREPKSIYRAFVRNLVEHVADLLLEHDISFQYDGRLPRAYVRQRMLYSDFVLTEKAYSTTLHEFAHLVEPKADGHQQRHVFLDKAGMASPVAECEAWKWAVAHCLRGYWTAAMHEDLADALRTYKGVATFEERDLIDETIAWSFSRVVPAPDTLEGRERVVQQIGRQEVIRKLEIDLRYQAVMRRA